ncbi:cold shock domain-containing protein [Maribellus luteus]|uniref:Cold shock domain-containing protein n=1 Tax=Maribellus luteus TaxID=2305463 RepID=A0A399SUC9_9BACT|nr:cold shock domain-containing protein [Maribellus luteus]RIJ45575.1 cold shock domain-containing protein [Maribellus luteus]
MGRSSISFNKKELEKKRARKRKEKQQRKEVRKANGGSGSLDDMIAYVDENGVITDTQPDPIKKKVDANKIAISTPKKQEEEDVPLKGRVEHFKKDKGYGFIKDMASTEKYFFHISDAYPNITEGNKVSFELAKGNRGLNAVKIEPAE